MYYSIHTLLDAHQNELVALCQQYRVRRLYVFGSLIKGTFDRQRSDLDFLAQLADRIPNREYADRFLGLEVGLHEVFKFPVDLLTVEGLKNAGFRQRVEETRALVYESDNAL